MKKIITFLVLFVFAATANSQVTSINQLKDAKPGTAYYEDLRYMVEVIGSVSGDSDRNFRPDKPVTKGYWATVTNATFDRINEMIATSQYDVKDSIKRDNFGIDMLTAMPTNYCNIKDAAITSTSQLKDVNVQADYYMPVQSLVERYGLTWLATPTTFAPNAAIAEADFRIFFTNAFGASFEMPGTGFLTRGNFIVYTAAWAKNFIAKIEKKVKEANQ